MLLFPAWLATGQWRQPLTHDVVAGLIVGIVVIPQSFGFALLERRVFEAVEKPMFMIEYCKETGVYTTEDHPFFRKAREAGFPCYVDHDASKLIWHVGYNNYVWNQDYTPRGV